MKINQNSVLNLSPAPPPPALIVNCWKIWSGARAQYIKTGL